MISITPEEITETREEETPSALEDVVAAVVEIIPEVKKVRSWGYSGECANEIANALVRARDLAAKKFLMPQARQWRGYALKGIIYE